MGQRSVAIAALVLLWAGQAAGQTARHTPQQLTEQVVSVYQALSDPAVPEIERRSAAREATLDRFFDYQALSAAPFKRHQKSIKADQLASLQKSFRAILTHLTHHAGDEMASSEVRVGTVRAQGELCIVDFEVNRKDDDVSSKVGLTWQRRGQAWQVVDVAFDGASITKDYENQFGRIIQKDGVKALQAKLQQRLAQITQSNR